MSASRKSSTLALGLSVAAAAVLGVALLAAVKPSLFGPGASGSRAGKEEEGEEEEEEEGGGGRGEEEAAAATAASSTHGDATSTAAPSNKKPLLRSKSWFEEERQIVSNQIQDRAEAVVRQNQKDALALQRVATLISMFNESSMQRAAVEARAHPLSVDFVFSHDLLQQTLQDHVGNIQKKAMMDSYVTFATLRCAV